MRLVCGVSKKLVVLIGVVKGASASICLRKQWLFCELRDQSFCNTERRLRMRSGMSAKQRGNEQGSPSFMIKKFKGLFVVRGTSTRV